MRDENLYEEIPLAIISTVGMAKSLYVEAVNRAREGDFKGAEQSLEEGRKLFKEGHDAHFDLLSAASNQEDFLPTLFIVHCEDQLASAETTEIMSVQMIELYRTLYGKNLL